MMHNPHIMPLSSERIVLAYSLLIVPTFDVIRVIIHRIHYKKPIFDADKSHIHHKFMSLGMNQHQALIAILMLQLGYIIFNLLLFHIGCNFTWILCIDIITYTLLHILTIHRIQKQRNEKNDRLYHSGYVPRRVFSAHAYLCALHQMGRWSSCHLQAGKDRSAWQAFLHL